MVTYSWSWGQVIKAGASMIVASSASSTIREVIKNNVEAETAAKALQLRIGTAAIGAIVYGHVWKYTGEQVDILAKAFGPIKQGFQDVQAEQAKSPKDADVVIDVEAEDKSE